MLMTCGLRLERSHCRISHTSPRAAFFFPLSFTYTKQILLLWHRQFQFGLPLQKPYFVLPCKNDYWVSFDKKKLVSGEIKPGGTCVFITPAPLFFQAGLSGVVDLLSSIVLWVLLVVCHVNSSQKGTFSTFLFKSTLSLSLCLFIKKSGPGSLFLCSPSSLSVCVSFSRSFHLYHTPRSQRWHWLICPTADLTVYWGFRCQWGRKDPAGLSASLTPLSQWLLLPPTRFPAKLGRVNIYQPPTTMGSSEEKKTLTRAHARPVGNSGVCRGLKTGCRKI